MRSAVSIVLATTEPPSWDMFTNLGASLLEGLVLFKHKAVTVLDYRKLVTIQSPGDRASSAAGKANGGGLY